MAAEFYLGNPNLKAAGVKLDLTPEQLLELDRCEEEPVYFFRNYAKIQNLDKGLTCFDPYPYQQEMIRLFYDNRYVIVKIPRQSGKCVTGDSLIRLRNRVTGERQEIPIEEFYRMIETRSTQVDAQI